MFTAWGQCPDLERSQKLSSGIVKDVGYECYKYVDKCEHPRLTKLLEALSFEPKISLYIVEIVTLNVVVLLTNSIEYKHRMNSIVKCYDASCGHVIAPFLVLVCPGCLQWLQVL